MRGGGGVSDLINHPPHYAGVPGIKGECIGYTRQMSFALGNAFKYVFRAGSKGDTAEDLKKALWYVLDAMENGRGPIRAVPLIPDVRVPMTRRRYVLGCIARGDLYKASVLIRDLSEHPEHLDKEMS